MNLFEHIKSILSQNEKYCKDGKLFKNVIVEDALKVEQELLSLLLSDDKAIQHFFTEVGKVLVFDKIKFQKFVSNKQFLPDSYTSFKNKIGLTANGEYLTEAKEVVLSWAYKDCVLEGGQSKDEQKLNEVFWNETLAPDEIDRLLEPKAFTNFKRYTDKGESPVKNISLEDNLIIKGNNLLALHSLKKVYKEKVKLIFIDPPYNTESDSFRYNDNFNHSTWLTFMKNRLEVAKELLSKDGLIWISLSDKEAHYLKVLADEVFDQDNFVSDVIWNSTKSVTNTAIISDAHTHILLYAKSKTNLKQNRTTFRLTADESKFSNPDNDPRGKWVADPFQVGGERPNQLFEITNPNTGKVYKPNPGSSWKNEKKVFDELLKDNRIVFGVSGDAGPQRKRFWSEAKERG
ncbi:MAG: site-specific DNA-methyltransferase, partial [Flavobacteriales bacterium]|nr:site-specific DNA-methyltransferase [Flavobacteriales bacterium]